jgi:hypothetical protein
MDSFPPGSEITYITKTTTGDPAAPADGSPTICINTFDKTVKIYVGVAWRAVTLTAAWT